MATAASKAMSVSWGEAGRESIPGPATHLPREDKGVRPVPHDEAGSTIRQEVLPGQSPRIRRVHRLQSRGIQHATKRFQICSLRGPPGCSWDHDLRPLR
jgi:hypothetical protein